MTKTRRGFMRTGLGCIGLGGLVGTGIINAKTIQPVKVSPDYEAGMQAGINAGKSGPFLGWKCLIDIKFGDYIPSYISEINFKEKTIIVRIIPNELERKKKAING